MAAKTTTVRKDMIPYEAGVVILDPLDENKQPDYTRSVATGYDFLTSTQVSITRTSETLENGNGQDKEYPLDETYTMTVTGNVYNPIFHGVVTGQIETLPDKTLMPHEISYNLPSTATTGTNITLVFGTGGALPADPIPAADESGEVNFIVEDSYGNVLTRLDEPEFGAYSYDKDTKTLEFSKEYAGALIRVIYNYEVTNAIQYTSNPIIQNPEYQVRVFGVRQSASTGETYNFMEKIARATATGDISNQATQKSKSAPITYTFTSTPVPKGTSVYSSAFAPSVTTNEDDGTAIKNRVNGCDDNFGTATEP